MHVDHVFFQLGFQNVARFSVNGVVGGCSGDYVGDYSGDYGGDYGCGMGCIKLASVVAQKMVDIGEVR